MALQECGVSFNHYSDGLSLQGLAGRIGRIVYYLSI